ncbi:hypothetical protein HMPREF9318_01253 [Streptococcus urinalis FB127-CNA-2]|uniref:PF06149 family protein n=1 Tax=Streptococcus urinalis 2285-97 TaxID=764291 RepID=G5KCA1_9STRE|nr:DUF969 family protein [Streptococcus urinalis]EHJ55913.1 hypothetical protein STRUR_0415 [Streptococcus urinalis 2285-97]EKS19731.1 hypothetical protein HMPREF9318_01253 [Streptococcus urinalis FB127-CNA-2]VEF31308.1 permease [Streptococcus urinalis]
MELIKLIGILIIVIGFLLKLDTIATVVVAGLVTALVSGISFFDFLELLGKEFTNQRIMTIFIITLPLIGLSETFGLKQRAVYLIKQMKTLTVGRFYTVYLIIREIAGLFSIRLGGHPQFVRPLVEPMGEAAAEAKVNEELTEDEVEEIKARAAANENFGNFFAQNTFAAAGGVLLISGTIDQLGYESNSSKIAFASMIIAVISIIVVGIYNYQFDKKIEKNHKKVKGE